MTPPTSLLVEAFRNVKVDLEKGERLALTPNLM